MRIYVVFQSSLVDEQRAVWPVLACRTEEEALSLIKGQGSGFFASVELNDIGSGGPLYQKDQQ